MNLWWERAIWYAAGLLTAGAIWCFRAAFRTEEGKDP